MPKTIKIAILGSGGVGKTTLLNKLTGIDQYDIPPLEIYDITSIINNPEYQIDLIDMGNVHQALRDLHLHEAKGYILMYSVIQMSTFHEVEDYMGLIERVKDVDEIDDIPIVIIGNKCDREEERVIGKEEGIALAEKHHWRYYEMSALYDSDIAVPIMDLFERVQVEDVPVAYRRHARCLVM